MKKRLVALILALVCVAMTACGGQNTGSVSSSENPNEQTSSDQGGSTPETDSKENQENQNTETTTYENPVTVVFEYEDESMETAAGEVFFYASYTKPEVHIQGNQEAEKKINLFFEQDEELFEDTVADARQDAEEYYANTQGQANYLWYSDMSVGRADAGLISIVEREDTYLGGAHGSYYSSGFTFDTQTGTLLKLESLSDDPAGFYSLVKNKIIAQCQDFSEQEAFYHPTDSEEFAATIDDVMQSDSWYFTREGLVVVANPYFIGPYAAGMFTFVIPYEELDGLLDKYAYHGPFMKSVLYGEDCIIDLDSDGKEETIKTSIKMDDYSMITMVQFDISNGSAGITIDNNYAGEDDPCLEYPMEKYYIIDLDKSDDYLEIAVGDYGYNDYNATYFYRFDGEELIYLGWIPNVLDDFQVEVYGNGIIKGTMRMEMVETVRCHVTYQLDGEKVALVEQEWYVPDYSDFPEEYLTHDVLQDVTVYADKDVKSAKIVLKAGEKDVRFLATDNEEWVKMQTANGKICYMHMAQPIIIDSDGRELIVPEVFEDILLAG